MTYVEEVVGTGELLEHLECHDEEGTIQLLVLRVEASNPSGPLLLLVLDSSAHILELQKDMSEINSMQEDH